MVGSLLLSVIASYHVMKQVTIVDKTGFEKPLPAATMLIPKDWSFESAIAYTKPGGCSGIVLSQFKAVSPDGKTALEAFPAYGWQWNENPDMRQLAMGQNQQNAQMGFAACDVQQPMNATQFLQFTVPRVRKDAQIVKIEAIPGVRDVTSKQVQQLEAYAQQIGLPSRYGIDDARARVTYTVGGAKVEEWLTVLVNSMSMSTPMMGGVNTSYTFTAQTAYGLRAPAGQLDANENLFKAMIGSIRLDPEWSARIAQLQANINAQNAKGAADRAKIRADANAYTGKLITEGHESRQKSQERSAQQFSQYIREVESYRDPSSGKSVELPSFYNHAWSNGKGEYVITDSPGFKPGEVLPGSWSEMQRVKQ